MGKENASEGWNITFMFLTSFNIYFVFGYACFIFVCFMTAIWSFPTSLELGLAFFCEVRLATLIRIVVIKRLNLTLSHP